MSLERLLERAIYKSDDDMLERRKKQVLLATFLAATMFSITMIGLQNTPIGTVGAVFSLVAGVGGVSVLVVYKSAPQPFFEVFSYFFMIAIILKDYESAANYLARRWPMIIILIDAIFVCEVSKRVPRVVMAMALTWFAVSSFESGFRYGVFDLPGTDTGHRKDVCTCDNPPCTRGIKGTLGELLIPAAVLIFDYFFTRHVAEASERDRRRMAISIEATKTIALALADFNLDDASEALDEAAPNLPTPLIDAYQRILTSLREFRPYLDQSCLVEDEEKSSIRSATMSLLRRRLSLVCVNIKSTLQMIDTDKERFLTLHQYILEKAVSSFSDTKGVVDLFIGDKVFVSYNASQNCPLHAVSAVKGVIDLLDRLDTKGVGKTINAGVVAGFAQVGYLGCMKLRRFCILGKLTTYLTELERYGRRKGLDFVCDRWVALDIGNRFEKRLILEAVRAPGLFDETLFHYEILWTAMVQLAKAPCDDSSEGVEWMYVISRAPGEKWEIFNDAARAFLQGDSAKARGIVDQDTAAEDVKPFVNIICEALQKGAEPEPPVIWTTPNSQNDTQPDTRDEMFPYLPAFNVGPYEDALEQLERSVSMLPKKASPP
eukprot:TRINITY_DN33443_c0_g1_i1.p1 TRINITY_DN33443_c0_g1~~TRINITY_DN33443_c0_g1_i1.p1  ORF type:complete len:603 (+),score=232.67 TRINITY_DN33443_c0_g1_i1:40-1848(+)